MAEDAGLVEEVMRRNDRHFFRGFDVLSRDFSYNKVEFDSTAYICQEQFLRVSKLLHSRLRTMLEPFDMDIVILLVDVDDLSKPE
jgi:hypothetical protein